MTFEQFLQIENSTPLQNLEAYKDRACKEVDPSVFFPLSATRVDINRALKVAGPICDSCVVRQECYDFAVQNNERYGIWGGVAFERNSRGARVIDSRVF